MSSADHLSASRLNAYLGCPRRFAFRYVEAVRPEHRAGALAFGSAVHKAIEEHHAALLHGRKSRIDDHVGAFHAEWRAAQGDDLRLKEGETTEGLAATGENLVRQYVGAYPAPDVRGVEVAFEVPLGRQHRLTGVFDAVFGGDTIVELKTASRATAPAALGRNLQLGAYALAFRHVFGRVPKVRWVSLIKGARPRVEVHEVEVRPDGEAWFERTAVEVARAIESGAFPPNPGWACGDCEFRTACRLWGSVGAMDGEMRERSVADVAA